MYRLGLCFGIALLLVPEFMAQTSPFLDSKTERLLVNELSGDIAFDNIRSITKWHRPSGSEGFFQTARYVFDKAKEYGLEDVTWIDQAAQSPSWTCHRAEAFLIEENGNQTLETKLGSYEEVATFIADYSRSANLTAELIDVGAGDQESDYAGKEVRGKIVLAYAGPAAVMHEAVWKRGALGILSWTSTRLNPLADAPDQIAWQRVPEKDGPNGERTTFAFVISPRVGKNLSDRLRGEKAFHIFASEEKKKSSHFRLRALVESETLPEKKTAMVSARLKGTEPGLPEIVLTGHLQEEKFSANDDGSGVANVLEIGRALSRLIREGQLARPRRGIRFWWCDEIYSEYRYFADHPDETSRFLCNLNQDMVGAKQSVGGREQHLSRTPWSRPSFISDIVESVLEMVVLGNTAYLNAWQAGSIPRGVPFSKPIFSRLGSREPYRAHSVAYFDSTDHLVFNDSWVGVPGVSLTNWPDEYIHSSDDDLWQIDPTQLKRNAFVVAVSAWWTANAEPKDIPLLASHLFARSLERLGRDLAAAIEILRAEKDSPERQYARARGLIDLSVENEKEALTTAMFPAAGESGPSSDGSRKLVASFVSSLEIWRSERLKALDEINSAVRPGWKSALLPEDKAEKRLLARVPKKGTSTLSEWMELEHKVAEKREAEEQEKGGLAEEEKEGPELHGQMKSEVMNLIDGKRTAGQIYRIVSAEAASAGAWYYGEVTAEMVEKFLEEQVKDGLISW